MASGVNGKTIAIVTGGGVVMYAGLKGVKISTVTRALLSGQDPTTLTQDNPITAAGSGDVVNYGAPGDTSTSSKAARRYVNKILGKHGSGNRGPVVAALPHTNAAQNQHIARILCGPYGWSGGSQFAALVQLWDSESGWSQFADTRKSGLDPANATVFAYGIPQSRPYSKMPKVAWPADKGGHSDPTAQIAWGLRYIKQNYGSPSAALHYKYTGGQGKGY